MKPTEDWETVLMCSYDNDPLTPEQNGEFDNATTCIYANYLSLQVIFHYIIYQTIMDV